MKLIDQSIRYPVSVIVGILLAALFGLIGFSRLPVQMIPTIDRPEISVETLYPGAAPPEVEEEVTRRQEELLNTVENLREMTSVSEEGRSRITLKYDIITEPFEYADGYLTIPDKPGLGVELDMAKIEKYRVA